MERRNRSFEFLNEISGPFVPPPEPTGVPKETIRTELPMLVEVAIRKLNMDQQDSFGDFLVRMNKRTLVKRYKEKHQEEYRIFHLTPTGKQLRILRFAAFLLKNSSN